MQIPRERSKLMKCLPQHQSVPKFSATLWEAAGHGPAAWRPAGACDAVAQKADLVWPSTASGCPTHREDPSLVARELAARPVGPIPVTSGGIPKPSDLAPQRNLQHSSCSSWTFAPVVWDIQGDTETGRLVIFRQLSLLPSVGQEMSIGPSAAGSKGRMAHFIHG